MNSKIEWMKVIGATVAITSGFALLHFGERDFALLAIGTGIGVLIPFQFPGKKSE
jgi:hypothetical protein